MLLLDLYISNVNLSNINLVLITKYIVFHLCIRLIIYKDFKEEEEKVGN